MNEDRIYPSMVIRSQSEAIELLEQENKQLQQERDKYKSIVEELKKWCERNIERWEKEEQEWINAKIK